MIEINNISHSYGDKLIIDKLSLSVNANELTCLLGGSGSGKTTILRLIAGLETPLLGEIIIDKNIVSKGNTIVIPPYKRELAYIFQDLALWPHFTVYKNIAFGLTERKEKNVDDKVLQMLEFFNLQEYAKKFPHQLSGGQKQLLAIARSLVLKPKVLLMDEPLSNLDVKLKRKLLDYIKKLQTEFNLTIIYVTHDHREAFSIADKVFILNNGNIEDSGTISQIKLSENKFTKYFLEY